MKDLVVSVLRADRVTRQVVPVTEIAGDDMSLAPGERRTLELTTQDVPVQAMRDLMADPTSLIFEASRLSLVDQYGVDFAFRMSDVMAYCAAVTLDYGDRSERFFIAANIQIDGGVSLGMALTQAGIDFTAEPIDDDALTEGAEVWDITINGRGTELHEDAARDLGERYPYPEGLEPGRRKVKRGWFGALRPAEGSTEEPPFTANLFDARIRAGDEIILVYSEDLDRDGVPAFEEARWGSSDLTPHSDGDGMSDYWETRVGWKVETASRAPYRVFSSPAATDTDGDHLDDDQEAEAGVTDAGTGLDPWLDDTDQDGFNDRFEYDDVAYGLDPTRPADINAIPKPTATCEIVLAPRAGDAPYRYLVRAAGADPQSDLVELAVDFGGPRAIHQSDPIDKLEITQPLERCFVSPGVVTVTATDALGFETTTLCTWGEDAPHEGELCNGVDDDCDGVVDDGCPAPGQVLTLDYIPTDTPRVTNQNGDGRNTLDCGDRMLRAIKVYSGSQIDKVGAYCTTPRLGQPFIPAGRTENVYPVLFEGYDSLIAEYGGQGGGDSTHLNCGDVGATVAMGIEGRAGSVIDQLRVVCSSMQVERVNGTYQIVNWWTANTTTRGGDGGSPFGRQCDVGTLVNRVNVWSGSRVDDLTLSCARYRLPIIAAP
ncbi:MAG: hypothetical protein JNJ59_16655, partial [Deltaproteobacteria bacterium]|nr:hypothetical protein [Deltaproteobacteria bacterium]